MKVVVIGAGAMGSLYAGLLARGGQEVSVIDGWAEHVAAIRDRGLRLSGITGPIEPEFAGAYGWAEAAVLAGQADIAIILVNANDTDQAARLASMVLKPDGFVYGLQNGIGNLELYRKWVGPDRVVGGLSYHSAAIRGPGHVEHTHAGATWLGELDGRPSERVERLAEALSGAGFTPQIVPDMEGQIWTKFIHNSAINPVCALLGLRVGEIPSTPGADEMQTRIIEEALAVVRAKGVPLADPDPMGTIKAFCRVKFNKPSMLQHMEASRPTEIDALNGAIVREGAALGIPTPFNQAITWMIKGLQHQRIEIAAKPPIDYEALEKHAKEKHAKAKHLAA